MGVNLAAAFAKVLEEYGISKKVIVSVKCQWQNNINNETYQIFRITCDNTSANDAMIDSLAKIVLDFPGESNHAHCLAHIANLVVKIILHQFDVSKKKGKNNAPKNNAPNNPDLAGDTSKKFRQRKLMVKMMTLSLLKVMWMK